MAGTVVVSAAAANNEDKELEDKYICEDIIREIIKHFSLKSLGKFQCVSENWQSLIYDQLSSIRGFFYQESHLSENGFIHFFSFTNRPFKNTWIRTQKSSRSSFKIVASSNGALLGVRSDKDPQVHYYVCKTNLTTISTSPFLALPKPRNLFTAVKTGFYFDPSNKSPDSSASPTFFVVRWELQDFSNIEVYSSETNVWSSVKLTVEDSVVSVGEGASAAYLDGVFFWLDSWSQILAVDLIKCKVWKVKLPDSMMRFGCGCLQSVDGALQMAVTDFGGIEIWILRNKGSGCVWEWEWELKKGLCVKTLVGNNTNTFPAGTMVGDGRRILGIVGFEGRNSEKILVNTLERVLSIDLNTQKVEPIVELICRDINDFLFFPYRC